MVQQTGGFVRPTKKFTLDPSSKDLLAKTPHSMRRPSKGQGGEGRPQSRGGKEAGGHVETGEGPTAAAGGTDHLASTERLPGEWPLEKGGGRRERAGGQEDRERVWAKERVDIKGWVGVADVFGVVSFWVCCVSDGGAMEPVDTWDSVSAEPVW
jgi:hypothetical protein